METLAPLLPKIRFAPRQRAADPRLARPRSRQLALHRSLVEGRGEGVFGVPLEVRSLGNPLATSQEAFDSRIVPPLAVGQDRVPRRHG